jgi:non-ribosomal peptide synthetase component F
MSSRTAFNYHDDSAAVIEICDRNAAPLPRATTAGLNDEGIVAVIWRPWNASKKPVSFPEEGMQVLLLDESGHAVGVGAVGQIAVKSRYLSLGYWRRPDLTQARFLPA